MMKRAENVGIPVSLISIDVLTSVISLWQHVMPSYLQWNINIITAKGKLNIKLKFKLQTDIKEKYFYIFRTMFLGLLTEENLIFRHFA